MKKLSIFFGTTAIAVGALFSTGSLTAGAPADAAA
jgi:hypothetical protein